MYLKSFVLYKHVLILFVIVLLDMCSVVFCISITRFAELTCSYGRVVKASDSKSDGIFPRRFESCWLRMIFLPIKQFHQITWAPKFLLPAINLFMSMTEIFSWTVNDVAKWDMQSKFFSMISFILTISKQNLFYFYL